MYVTGWPRSGGTLRQPIFVTTEGNLTEDNSVLPLGYSLSYNNLVRAGMSGGAILDAQDKLIGINGVVRLIDGSDRIIASGIPINAYLRWRATESDLPLTSLNKAQPIINPPNSSTNSNSSSYTLTQTLALPTGAVNSLAFNPINKNIISGNSNGTISIWQQNKNKAQNQKSYQEFAHWQSHNTAINAIALTPDGKILASGDDRGVIQLFDLINHQLLSSLTGHTDAITGLVFSPDGQKVISSSWDKTIRVWQANTGLPIATFSGHSQVINAIALTPDGKILASASQDKTIRLWDLATGKLIDILKGHSLAVLSLAINHNGKTLASGGGDGSIKLWQIDTKQLTNTFQAHTDGIWSIAISTDHQIFSSSWDKTIKVWHPETGIQGKVDGHQDAVFSLILSSPDNQILIGRDWQGQIYIWHRQP